MGTQITRLTPSDVHATFPEKSFTTASFKPSSLFWRLFQDLVQSERYASLHCC